MVTLYCNLITNLELCKKLLDYQNKSKRNFEEHKIFHLPTLTAGINSRSSIKYNACAATYIGMIHFKLTKYYYNSSIKHYQNLRETKPEMVQHVTIIAIYVRSYNLHFFLFLNEMVITVNPAIILINEEIGISAKLGVAENSPHNGRQIDPSYA